LTWRPSQHAQRFGPTPWATSAADGIGGAPSGWECAHPPEDPQPTLMCGLNAVGAQSGWKCAGMPPPLSHAYLVGFSATGAPDGLGRGYLEPHRDLVSRATQLITGGPGGGYSPSGRAQPRADSKSRRARAPCGTRAPLGGSICPRKPPARAHGAAGRDLAHSVGAKIFSF